MIGIGFRELKGGNFLCGFPFGSHCWGNMIAEDAELLHLYAANRDEAAFAELVRRYLNLVYFAALRQVGGDAYGAEDVAQNVFTLLARKASALSRHQTLAGWLHTTTRFAASEAMRTERRRLAREQEAHTMHELFPGSDPTAHADWERLRPIIDEALGDLGAADREAVLLRFFAGLPLAAIGVRLNVSENAARMRVERALEKLQALLARRGMTSTNAALGVALGGQAALAAPAGLAASVTSTALAGSVVSGVAAAAAGIFGFMSTTKIVIAVISVGALVTTGLYLHERQKTLDANTARALSERERATLRAENTTLQTRLGTAVQSARSAEDDTAALLQAVGDFRAGQKSAKTPDRPRAKDTTLLSRDAALAEVTAIVEQWEAKARSKPGYKPYQPPDESLLSAEQRRSLEQARATAKAKNQHVFVVFGPPGGTIYIPQLGSERIMKAYPQLTREDWLQLNERNARALAENEIADWPLVPSPRGK